MVGQFCWNGVNWGACDFFDACAPHVVPGASCAGNYADFGSQIIRVSYGEPSRGAFIGCNLYNQNQNCFCPGNSSSPARGSAFSSGTVVCYDDISLDSCGAKSSGSGPTYQSTLQSTVPNLYTTSIRQGCPSTQARFRVVTTSEDKGWMESGSFELSTITLLEYAVFINSDVNQRFTGAIFLSGPCIIGQLATTVGNPTRIAHGCTGVYGLSEYYTGELCHTETLTVFQQQQLSTTTYRTTTYQTTLATTTQATTTNATTSTGTTSNATTTNATTTNATTTLQTTTDETTAITTSETPSTLPETGIADTAPHWKPQIGILFVSVGFALYATNLGEKLITRIIKRIRTIPHNAK